MGVTGSITHTYVAAGTYTVTIRGDFPRIYFNNIGDYEKILSVEQWGTIAWISMNSAFEGCSNLVVNATDAPDLTVVTDASSMFSSARSLADRQLHLARLFLFGWLGRLLWRQGISHALLACVGDAGALIAAVYARERVAFASHTGSMMTVALRSAPSISIVSSEPSAAYLDST